MANILKLLVENPDELLNTGAYGAGALIRVERSTTGGSGYAEIGTVALVGGQTIYTYYDQAGSTSSWYRTRYSNAGNTVDSDYSAEFQASDTSSADYCSLGEVKARLGVPDTDTSDDEVLLDLIGQVSGWIESFTGRAIRPIPAISTTLSSAASIGATSVSLTSAVNIAAGDALLFGPVSGTHEHGIVISVSGTTVTLQAGLANAYASSTAVSRVWLFDGFDALENGRMVPAPRGIVSGTSLEVAYFTNGTFQTIPATDWFLRPTPYEREPGWPATELWMTDIPSSNNPSPMFYRGFQTIRLAGSFGWPAIPVEIESVALNVTVAAYRARGSGGGDTFTLGSDGTRTFERLLGTQDFRTLLRYRVKSAVII